MTTLFPIVGWRFPFSLPRPAQDRALIQRDVFAYLGRLADDDAHAVVDEAARADDRRRMDLDAGQEPADVRQKPRRKSQAPPPKKVGDAVHLERVKARVAEEHLPDAARRWIPLEDRLEYLA